MSQKRSLSTEEVKAIKEFQGRVQNVLQKNCYQDSSIFYRFLKARDFDVDKAEKMLRNHIIWRKSFQIDTILEDFKPKEIFLKYIEPNVLGLDKDGDLITYVALGKMESKDILKCITSNDLLRHVTWFGEKCFPFMKRQGEQDRKQDLQMALIMDLDELTFSNTTSRASIELMLRVTHLAQDNFPERLKSVKLINAPGFYVLAYTILKAVMSTVMVNKIRVFGRNGWKEHFLESMDADVLPAFLGGNLTDPDGNPRCTTFMVHGGKPAAKYTLSEKDRYFTDVNHVQSIVVPSMEKREIYIEVTENGSLIEWEFWVKSKDISFGLSFQRYEEVEEILPLAKYTTPDGTEKGSYRCQSAGKYIIIFYNSDSWWSSKDIEYAIALKGVK